MNYRWDPSIVSPSVSRRECFWTTGCANPSWVRNNWGIVFSPLAPALLAISFFSAAAGPMPPSLEESAPEPLKYTGSLTPDKWFFDGKLPHAVGVHRYQAFRANRAHPSEPGPVGFTYNHQPYLSYWNGKFYLHYLAGLVAEHTPPTRTMLTTSLDGRTWSKPTVLFPEYDLPEIKDEGDVIPAGTKSVMHQRMGFFVSPNGKLLTFGFYGFSATPRRSPNAGNGLGRVVREVRKDGSMGPIYLIRYNRHAGFNETNTRFPFYQTSKDKGFLAACESVLTNNLIKLQWWEEDRAKDGFYPLDPTQAVEGAYFSSRITTSEGAGKAFNFFHRPDGVVVGLWKNQYSALSADEGATWTKITRNVSLLTCGAKTWGQRTDDGRYAIVHDQSATRRNRFPMVAIVGDDGHAFDRMFCLHGEIPPKRYQGIHKIPGPQYFRGIIEGNGNPPGDEMWNTYSMNKEDLWVSRTRVPITGSVATEVNDDFNQASTVSDLELWSIYSPKWAPVAIEQEGRNKFLALRDEEPSDYALAERVFPAAAEKEIRFRYKALHLPRGHALEIEVQDQKGNRPIRLRIDKDWFSFDHRLTARDPVRVDVGKWYDVTLKIDCRTGKYRFALNGSWLKDEISFGEKSENVERIVFRTGPYRGAVPADWVNGDFKTSGFETEDMSGADEKSPLCFYYVDDLTTK